MEGGNDAEVLKAMAGIHAEMLLRGWCPHLLVELHLLLSILQVVVREGCDCTHTPSPPQPGSWFHSVGELRFYLHEVLWRCLPLLDACVGPVAPWQALFATSTSSSPFSSSSSPLCGAPAVGSLLCPTERASHTPSSMGGPRRGQPPDTASPSAPSAAPATSSSSSSSSLGSATHSFSLGSQAFLPTGAEKFSDSFFQLFAKSSRQNFRDMEEEASQWMSSIPRSLFGFIARLFTSRLMSQDWMQIESVHDLEQRVSGTLSLSIPSHKELVREGLACLYCLSF